MMSQIPKTNEAADDPFMDILGDFGLESKPKEPEPTVPETKKKENDDDDGFGDFGEFE